MNTAQHIVRSLSTLALAGIVSLAGVTAAEAAPLVLRPADVKLRDGSVWKGDVGAMVRATFDRNGREVVVEGTISRLDSKIIVIETNDGTGSKRTIPVVDLKRLETITAASTPGDSASKPTPATSGAKPSSGAAASAGAAEQERIPNIFVLPLEGTVGIGMRHEEIEQIGKEADKYGPGQVIVLEVNSPGGLVIEGDKIHETMKKLKERHRVVAWIKKAISAGAYTSLHCDEIYFMRVGALGSITMFSGTTAVTGRELEAWLEKVGEAAEIGGRPAIVGKAMVTNPILCSYDRDENGKVTWYDTLQGKYILSRADDNLTLNAENALHCKFSDGTADTVEELAKAMQLPKWREVSDVGRRIHANWQRTIKECREAKAKLYSDWSNPPGSDPQSQLEARIKTGQDILKWYDRCYPGMVYDEPNFPPDKKTFEDEVEAMKKQLNRIKKNQRN